MTEQDEPKPRLVTTGIYPQPGGSALVCPPSHSIPAGRTDPNRPRCTCARLPDAAGMDHPVNWLMCHNEVEVVTTSGEVYVGEPGRCRWQKWTEPAQDDGEGEWRFVVTHDDEAKDVDLPFAEIATVTPVRPASPQDALRQVAAAMDDLDSLLTRGPFYMNLPFGSEDDHEHLVITVERPERKIDCTPWPASMASVEH